MKTNLESFPRAYMDLYCKVLRIGGHDVVCPSVETARALQRDLCAWMGAMRKSGAPCDMTTKRAGKIIHLYRASDNALGCLVIRSLEEGRESQAERDRKAEEAASVAPPPEQSPDGRFGLEDWRDAGFPTTNGASDGPIDWQAVAEAKGG